MRGKGIVLVCVGHVHGITPAYAGKSGISPGFLLSYRDHPRVCGEKESVNDGTAIRAGSPPRMRGKARSCQANTSVTRITPAYAGKSRRVREPDTQTAGSPPRMRGKAAKHLIPALRGGITPAYAGKSLSARKASDAYEDHPRVCGEKENVENACRGHLGSPPRMRGKVSAERTKCNTTRITPAYAGKSYCL